jgi:hypothetical protein
MSVPIGDLSDRFGRPPTLRIAAVLCCIAIGALAFVRHGRIRMCAECSFPWLGCGPSFFWSPKNLASGVNGARAIVNVP